MSLVLGLGGALLRRVWGDPVHLPAITPENYPCNPPEANNLFGIARNHQKAGILYFLGLAEQRGRKKNKLWCLGRGSNPHED